MEYVLLLKSGTEGGLCMGEVMEFDTGGDSLRYFYDAIDCTTVDIVNAYGIVDAGGDAFCLVVDDEGLLSGKQINIGASLLYGYLQHKNPIVGDALVCKNRYTEDGTETVGMSLEEIDEIVGAINRLVGKLNDSL